MVENRLPSLVPICLHQCAHQRTNREEKNAVHRAENQLSHDSDKLRLTEHRQERLCPGPSAGLHLPGACSVGPAQRDLNTATYYGPQTETLIGNKL